ICNRFTADSKKDDNSKITCNITNGQIESNCWGVTLFGKGLDEDGSYDNEDLVLTMSDGTINIVDNNEGQGIATNASGGENAGFTINMRGGTVDGGTDGCGMYLPGPGITNISGDAHIIGELQGIRIAAGVLNIEGGTITNSSRRQNNSDLISGGSGGTAGAIVAGKASAGYVDDLIINIGNATIENTTGGDAIVVSDKNMADSDYEENKIEVTVSESTINGNVYTTSTIDGDDTNDGGNVSVKLEDVTVDGIIENKSKSPVTATGVTVTSVIASKDEEAGKVTIIESDITKAPDENSNIIIVNSTVDGKPTTTENVVAVNQNNGKTYEDLETALGEADDGDTIIISKDLEMKATDQYIVGEGVTLTAADDVTITIDGAEGNGVRGNFILKDDATLDGLNITLGENTAEHDIVSIEDNGATVKNCTFTGSYDGGEEVSRAIVMNAGMSGFTISDNTFNNLRQPAYVEGEGTISGNTTNNTSGWVVCADHKATFEDNKFGDNKVDIAIIANNNTTNEYADGITQLSKENDGASIQNEMLNVKADDGKLIVNPDDGNYTLDAAIDYAKEHNETIVLNGDFEDITVDEAVKIDANGYKITGDVSLANGSSIENADLSEVGEITVESGSADLSGNYWGEDGPKEIDGATIGTYYEDLTALEERDPTYVGDQLDTAKELLEKAKFEAISSKEANTKEAVDELVREKLDEILKGFEGEYTIVDSGFTAAVDGDAKNPDGTEGEYTFSVVLTYVGDSAKVENLTITITAAEYVPEDPDVPDPDPEEPGDNDDDNSSSSGGSSGGGSFIGHPDGWVPGGIIILDGSEQIQPTGSLLLDTKTYTMAPGVVYDILATLEGASENELRVYSSQPGVASVEAIGGGKYRVTGLADGQTYIMFEVWRDGVMLNHASVKVTIADGVTAYGESNREASIF
ncbi:MAG TPA: hypothetical protein IAA54_00995, partial [Candidatus Gallacutalibacter pullicola]|nr:hypothetical protein [Candidatus Gallacutalibacter pullicola]